MLLFSFILYRDINDHFTPNTYKFFSIWVLDYRVLIFLIENYENQPYCSNEKVLLHSVQQYRVWSSKEARSKQSSDKNLIKYL